MKLTLPTERLGTAQGKPTLSKADSDYLANAARLAYEATCHNMNRADFRKLWRKDQLKALIRKEVYSTLTSRSHKRPFTIGLMQPDTDTAILGLHPLGNRRMVFTYRKDNLCALDDLLGHSWDMMQMDGLTYFVTSMSIGVAKDCTISGWIYSAVYRGLCSSITYRTFLKSHMSENNSIEDISEDSDPQ